MIAWLIAWNTVKRTIGSRKGMLTMMIVPIIVISAVVAVFGRTSAEPAQIAVGLNDTGEYGAIIIEGVEKGSELYNAELLPDADAEALRALVDREEVDAAIYVPAEFSSSLLAGEPLPLELYRKTEQLWNAALMLELEAETRRLAALAETAAQGAARSGQPFEAAMVQLLEASGTDTELTVETHEVVLRASQSFVLVIGLMLMFVMVMVNQSIHGVMEDRANRTMARIYTAPVRAWQIALGNFLGSFMLGLTQLTSIVAIVRYVLGFDFGVPFGLLLLVLAAFLLAAVGIATAVAGLVRSTAQLGQLNNLIVVPTCMLGGCFWPVTFMPDFMQKLSYFTPQRWAIKALEELSIGIAASEIALHLVILLLTAAVLLAFGAFVLQPSQKEYGK